MTVAKTKALIRQEKAALAQRVTDTLHKFEQSVGGRLVLVSALQHAPQTDELAYVTALLADPRNDNSTLGEICRDTGITVAQLCQLFKTAKLAEAQVIATTLIGDGLTGVVADVMKRSVEHEIVCEVCFGIDPGKTARGKPKTCVKCGGKGFIKVQPSLKRQEIALEMGGLLKRGGGVNVNVKQSQSTTFVAGDAMAKFQRASDRILYGDREPAAQSEIVDADPVPQEV